jgi:hypothetical protein
MKPGRAAQAAEFLRQPTTPTAAEGYDIGELWLGGQRRITPSGKAVGGGGWESNPPEAV